MRFLLKKTCILFNFTHKTRIKNILHNKYRWNTMERRKDKHKNDSQFNYREKMG